MECNKEEAIRAKELAEKRMQNGQFQAARRIALKARQLYPDLENISQLIMVCEVHCSAENKIIGSEMDWYGILQIEKFSDETTIKKQFRKLALSLHPDKNKFAGAEAAFKLIGEANRVLTDPTKRPAYDMKCRSGVRHPAPKPPADQPKKDPKKPHVPANKFPNTHPNKFPNAPHTNKFPSNPHTQFASSHANQPPPQSTFWTSCPSCHVRYQYLKQFLNKMLRCQSCHQPFIARELGSTPEFSWNQFLEEKGFSNQGHSKFVPKNFAGVKPSEMNFPHRFPGSDPMAKVEKAADAGAIKEKKVEADNAPKTFAGETPQEKVNGHVDVKAGNGGIPTSEASAMKPKESGSSESGTNKRCRKPVEEFSKNSEKSKKCNSDKNVVVEENKGNLSAHNSGHTADTQSRKYLRQKQNISYKEDCDDDDFVVPPPKRSRGNSSSNMSDIHMAASLGDRVLKEEVSVRSAAPALDRNNIEVKQKVSSILEEKSSSKKTKSGDSKVKEDSVLESAGTKLENNDERSQTDTSVSNSEEVLKPEVYACPDPDFSNFESERAENNFYTNQVWAIYDPQDGMPRFYARIKKVSTSPSFKLQITWLEAASDSEAGQQWNEEDLPVGCGRYINGETVESEDHLMFSHQMNCMSAGRRGAYLVYPKKGETWALFKDWNADWPLQPEKHRPPYQFEFVEIMTEFTENVGVGVSYLGRVEGFVSIFQRITCDDVLSFCIQPSELYRFSHRVPSCRMSGKEGVGVPKGSFELDTAALPSNFFSGVDAKNNTGIGDSQANADQLGDRKRVASHEKLAQPGGVNSYFQASDKISTPKKQQDGEFVAVSSMPRRSPRDLGKRTGQANSNQPAPDIINKHIGRTRACSDGHPDVSSVQPDDKTNSHVKDGRFTSPLKSSSASGRKVVKVDEYVFKKDKPEDMFRENQIWAMHSDEDGLPRKYVQIKKIESTGGFKVHVAMLEDCMLGAGRRQSSPCGTFRVKSGKLIVLCVNLLYQKINAKSMGWNIYEICPRKCEIWAVYKNNGELSSDQNVGQCHIVEVAEENSDGVKVITLKPSAEEDTLYAFPTSKKLKSSTMDIPRSEFSRFSHQCLAYRHNVEMNGRSKAFWQLDHASIPGKVIPIE